MRRTLTIAMRTWRMREPFAISRGVMECQPVIIATLTDAAGHRGWGEACGVDYAGETPETMEAQIEAVRRDIEAGIGREALLDLLPAGGARLAIDAALWDLEAKVSGTCAFATAGVGRAPVVTAFTIGIRDVPGYAAAARARASYPLLKVKVGRDGALAAIEAVHREAPASRLIVDPNQAWAPEDLPRLAGALRDLNVVMLEQPVPVGAEAALASIDCQVTLCADELINDEADLSRARGRFGVINIKLDKAGGLTAALRLADAAEAMGFGLMVGCMAGSSLSMAPAMVLAQRCRFVDLDGPLLQAEDFVDGLRYADGTVFPPERAFWG
ncbi:MAG: dipeptide epimerase [Thermohalobaculum sp.]